MDRSGITGTFILESEEETLRFGTFIANNIPKQSILALSGDLGAGKTTFVKGMAIGLGIEEPILSPTFVLLNIYQNLYHFDLYRLEHVSEFLDLGFDECFQKNAIVTIEWPERIEAILPENTIYFKFTHENEKRICKVTTCR